LRLVNRFALSSLSSDSGDFFSNNFQIIDKIQKIFSFYLANHFQKIFQILSILQKLFFKKIFQGVRLSSRGRAPYFFRGGSTQTYNANRQRKIADTNTTHSQRAQLASLGSFVSQARLQKVAKVYPRCIV
jgi:hypothetical protein